MVAIPEIAGRASARRARRASRCGRTRTVAYPARLRELSPSADAATRTYLARFALPNAGDAVQLGMTATVTIGAAGGRGRAPAALGPPQRGRRAGRVASSTSDGQLGAAARSRSPPTRRAMSWSQAASTRATRSSRSACRSSMPARRSASSKRFASERARDGPMKRFNLSDWAVHHPALVLFLILAFAAAGTSVLRCGSGARRIRTSPSRSRSSRRSGRAPPRRRCRIRSPTGSRRSCRSCPISTRSTTYTKPSFTAMQVVVPGQHAAERGAAALLPAAQEARRHPRPSCRAT